MVNSQTLLWLAFAVGTWCSTAGQTCLAAHPMESPASPEGAAVSLRIQLEAGLRARLPSEFAFIDRVVTMVDQNRLPRDMVHSTFLWARNKKPYPFPYFESGLRTRAAKQGIKL